VNHKKTYDEPVESNGFTLIELLTVIAIIAMLVALLMPAINTVRRIARETKQKAQFMTIELALEAFKNDYGDYPPSNGWDYSIKSPLPYCGAQKLAEAILGWDLMGFHPKSAWRADGLDAAGGSGTYDPARVRPDTNNNGIPDTLEERKARYIELENTEAFRLGGPEGLFENTEVLAPKTFVLCDVFGRKQITVVNQVTGKINRYNAGMPILYFKADPSCKQIGPPETSSIYKIGDNRELIRLGRIPDGMQHPFYQPEHFSIFWEYIMDPKASTTGTIYPYRPDTYILISAGTDGLYGTNDDIRNFGN
jgi:prepilin-type N-terminal cleavage/methylation domain-containing protein